METAPAQMREDLKWFVPHPEEHVQDSTEAHIDDDWKFNWE